MDGVEVLNDMLKAAGRYDQIIDMYADLRSSAPEYQLQRINDLISEYCVEEMRKIVLSDEADILKESHERSKRIEKTENKAQAIRPALLELSTSQLSMFACLLHYVIALSAEKYGCDGPIDAVIAAAEWHING